MNEVTATDASKHRCVSCADVFTTDVGNGDCEKLRRWRTFRALGRTVLRHLSCHKVTLCPVNIGGQLAIFDIAERE